MLLYLYSRIFRLITGCDLLIYYSGGNETSIQNDLAQIKYNKDTLTSVAFEKYNLGAHSTLIRNNLTDVTKTIQSFGLETWYFCNNFFQTGHKVC